MSNRGPMMFGEPIRLHWCGWESDTRRLSQAGWDISAHQGFDERMLQLTVRYPRENYPVYGMGTPIEYNYSDRFYHEFHRGPLRQDRHMIQMEMQLAHQIQFRGYNTPEFYPVDPEPSMLMEPEIRNIEDLAWFRTLPDRREDLIITPPTMQELMQTILDKQAPDQKGIRERARQRNNRIARIIRLAS